MLQEKFLDFLKMDVFLENSVCSSQNTFSLILAEPPEVGPWA